MKLYQIYQALKKEEITLEEAAARFGIEVKTLKWRLQRNDPARLGLILRTLDRIAAGHITRSEAQAILGIEDRMVNYHMAHWGVKKPMAKALIRMRIADIKWEIHKKWAVEYIAGTASIEEVSERSGLSSRMMRRWVAKLLAKHFGMVWKDLKALPLHRRKRLAAEIEVAEGLEYTKQAVAVAVARGDTTIEQEAIKQVRALYERKDGSDVRQVPKTYARIRRRGPDQPSSAD